MIDHLELHVSDPAASAAFFRAALAPLGYAQFEHGASIGFGIGGDVHPDFWVRPGGPSAPPPHVAFHCQNRALVDACHRAALAAGGRVHRVPMLFANLHPHYYAGMVFDPDGHNVEFVCHRAP